MLKLTIEILFEEFGKFQTLLPVFATAASVGVLPGLLLGLFGRYLPGMTGLRLEATGLLAIGYTVGLILYPLKTGSFVFDVILLGLDFFVILLIWFEIYPRSSQQTSSA